MDSNITLTEYGKVSKDAIPITALLAGVCKSEEVQTRIFTAIRSILRGETSDLTGFPSEVHQAVPRLQALDRRSQEMVAGFFGKLGADGDPNNSPIFIALGILMVGRTANHLSLEELRRLIEVFKDANAPIPENLSPCGVEASQIMQFLSVEAIRYMDGYLFGGDPAVSR